MQLSENNQQTNQQKQPTHQMFSVFRYEEIDSTNSEAWRLIDRQPQPNLGNTVIIAKRQTKGRGQRGHSWQSDLGGLFMSVILQPQLAAANAHQITMGTAWGIAKALNETGVNVQLKWLNDLLIDRRKVGGILTETRIEANQIRYAVVGIGINWTNEVPKGAIALGELPTTLSSMDELIEVVLKGVQMWQMRSKDDDMIEILTEYLEMLSDRTVYRTGHKTIDSRELQGQIIDIRPTGELVVRWEGNCQDAIYQPQTFSVGYQ
ncbi:biotin--[acetyl-CoA-carboxylase] ligase [Pseudanabaena sp. FACHB-1998]|uniref:biotin--[acetyl-CoA-carboxylase] ligase n=1 Tax=Pseudanabaena sp. FACHB-1998 TaxID=2692858 RepID=UPI00168108FB|nr:biotin--[acetyl-CoA-carboxylase] ligase [Pseudanabaena sp. FACHB-1998]MBD2176083.1 biotin--[acetyl-CoA-carboxylase] ligase [Pseudanabaena sp. FACHB-1998]